MSSSILRIKSKKSRRSRTFLAFRIKGGFSFIRFPKGWTWFHHEENRYHALARKVHLLASTMAKLYFNMP